MLSLGQLESGEHLVPDQLPWSHTGDQDYEHYGSSLCLLDPATLAVASPSYRVAEVAGQYGAGDTQGAGRVTLLRGAGAGQQQQEVVGEAPFTSLGSSLATVVLNIGGQQR